MKAGPLDRLTLDSLVRGDEADPDAWGSLVVSSTAAEQWSQAVARRAKLDTLASVLLTCPWVPELYSAIRSISRKRRPPTFTAQCWPRQALLGSVLGPGQVESARIINVDWGTLVTRPTALGETVHMRTERASAIQVFAVTRQGSQPLPGASWELEPGEAPVVLLAIAAEEQPQTLEAAVSAAQAVAGVILIEGHSQDDGA